MVRKALDGVGLMAVFAVVYLACGWLHRAYGPELVSVLGTCLGAAWVATSASRAMVDDFLGALRDVGMKLEIAALEMRMVLPQLSRQVNHVEQLSASRVADLEAKYPDFARAYGTRRLVRAGGVMVIHDSRLARILTAVESREAAF